MIEPNDTQSESYARYLVGRPRRRFGVDVQLPYRMHVQSLRLGRTLDVGCGTGRNLGTLDSQSVGVDHNAHSIAICRSRGLVAFTTAEFETVVPHHPPFDALLVAHVVEHMRFAEAVEMLSRYRDRLLAGARAIVITPQEAGFASDATHVEFFDHGAHRRLLAACGFVVERQYSFPFPRTFGRMFKHNEFVSVATLARAFA